MTKRGYRMKTRRNTRPSDRTVMPAAVLLTVLLVAMFCGCLQKAAAAAGENTVSSAEGTLHPVRERIRRVSVIGLGFEGKWEHDLNRKPLFETKEASLTLTVGSKGVTSVNNGFGPEEYWFEDGKICFKPVVTGFYVSGIVVEAVEAGGAKAQCEIIVAVLDLYQVFTCVLILLGAALFLRAGLQFLRVSRSKVNGYIGVRYFDLESGTSDFTVKKISGRKMPLSAFGITGYEGMFLGVPLTGLPDKRDRNGVMLRCSKKSISGGKRMDRTRTVYLESEEIAELTFQAEPGRGLTITFVSESRE